MGRDPRLILILSSERSGSTLTRVVLGAHDRIVSPQEIFLMRYPSYRAYREHKPVAIESLVEYFTLLGQPKDRAEIDRACADLDTHAVYRWLTSFLPPDWHLLDKTPAYANDGATLRRSTALEPFYIWLIRHPLGVVESHVRLKMAKRHTSDLTGLARQVRDGLARATAAADRNLIPRARQRETKWVVQQTIIREFLAGVPAPRQCRVYFEDLVRDPEATVGTLCAALGFGAQTKHRLPLGIGLLFEEVQLFHHLQTGPLVITEITFGARQNIIRQTETPGNSHGVTGAGDAVVQAISRRQRLVIKLDGGNTHPGMELREALDEIEMCGDHYPRPPLTQSIEEGQRQGSSFTGVGAGADLVEVDQGIAIRRGEDLAQAHQMPGEGRQALLQTLLIADIGKEAGKEMNPTRRRTGDRHPRLHHGQEESRRLQSHGLAAGSGAADDQGIALFAEKEVDRHHCHVARRAGRIDEKKRMAGATQFQYRRRHQLRRTGIGQSRVAGNGGAEVEEGKDALIFNQGRPVVAGCRRKTAQDALLLPFLLPLQML
jgi:hypothetical protein